MPRPMPVFVMSPGSVTVAVIASVAASALASAPTVQMPVAALYVPCDGSAETNASPAGSGSAMATPVASSGPALVSVIV